MKIEAVTRNCKPLAPVARRFAAVLLQVLLVAAAFQRASADEIPINNGRFSGGMTTVIALTPEQHQALLRQEEGERQVALNDQQKALLLADSGLAPSVIYLMDTRQGETACACNVFNLGLRFDDEHLEIPHDYLLSEEETANAIRESESE